MALIAGFAEHFDGGDGGVIAPYRAQGIEEDTLAVGAGAVKEKQHVFLGDAGEAIPGDAFEVSLQLVIADGHASEELGPQRDGSLAIDGAAA
jgi:hypothetical protein